MGAASTSSATTGEREVCSRQTAPSATSPSHSIAETDTQELGGPHYSAALLTEILLCLMGSLLMYLCQVLIKAVEKEDRFEAKDGYSELVGSDIVDSNASTYKALYENEVEINHRVFREMITLQRELDNMKARHSQTLFESEECCRGRRRREERELSASSPSPLSIDESSSQSMASSDTEVEDKLSLNSKDFNTPTFRWPNVKSLEPETSAATLNCIPSSPRSVGSGQECGGVFRLSGFAKKRICGQVQQSPLKRWKGKLHPQPGPPLSELMSSDQAVPQSQPSKLPPPAPILPPGGVLLGGRQRQRGYVCLANSQDSTKSQELKTDPKMEPNSEPNSFGNFDEALIAELSRSHFARRKLTLSVHSMLDEVPRPLSHSGEKLLAEIVVGRAKLRPRTRKC